MVFNDLDKFCVFFRSFGGFRFKLLLFRFKIFLIILYLKSKEEDDVGSKVCKMYVVFVFRFVNKFILLVYN